MSIERPTDAPYLWATEDGTRTEPPTGPDAGAPFTKADGVKANEPFGAGAFNDLLGRLADWVVHFADWSDVEHNEDGTHGDMTATTYGLATPVTRRTIYPGALFACVETPQAEGKHTVAAGGGALTMQSANADNTDYFMNLPETWLPHGATITALRITYRLGHTGGAPTVRATLIRTDAISASVDGTNNDGETNTDSLTSIPTTGGFNVVDRSQYGYMLQLRVRSTSDTLGEEARVDEVEIEYTQDSVSP